MGKREQRRRSARPQVAAGDKARAKWLRQGLRLDAPPAHAIESKRRDPKVERRSFKNNRWRDDAGGCSRLGSHQWAPKILAYIDKRALSGEVK